MGIGDEIMAAGAARRHYQRTGRRVRIQHPNKARWFDVWNNLPWIVQPGEPAGTDCDVLQAKDHAGLRPYIAAKLPRQWIWKAYWPSPSDFVFSDAEWQASRAAEGSIIVEPNIKPAASPNKDWGWLRWQKLINLAPDLDWVQLGPAGTRSLKGVRRIETGSFRQAAAMLKRAHGAVLTEGALHHAAAATRTPAVVIFGGYISPAVTGYAAQRNLFTGGADHPLGCGARVPCAHCAKAMMAITPEQALAALRGILDEEHRRDLAA